MNRETETSDKKPWSLKPTYIPRLMPVGMIVILLAILIPVLREKKPDAAALPFPGVDVLSRYLQGKEE